MFPKEEHFINPERFHIGIQKTTPAIFETRNKLLSKERGSCTQSENIWHREPISNEFYHNQLRPVLIIRRVFGVLPVKLPIEGKYRHYK
jgi:hypothetical protein